MGITKSKKYKVTMATIMSFGLFLGHEVHAGDVSVFYNTYKRIAGVPTALHRQSIIDLAQQDDMEQLVSLATETQTFGFTTALAVAEKFCNRTQDAPWNDCTWTVAAGIVLDHDLRDIVWGDRLATANIGGLAAVSASSNNHYSGISKFVDVKASAVMQTQSLLYGFPLDTAAGLFTFRETGRSHFNAGTNRGAIEKVFEKGLGIFLKNHKDPTVDRTYIAGDVVYRNSLTGQDNISCLGCHTKLDATRGAFAYLDYVGMIPRVTKSQVVVEKYARNAGQNNGFPTTSGYVTTDDRWVNYYKQDLGFRSNNARGLTDANISAGNGPAAFAKAVSETTAFSKYLARLAMDIVCNEPDYSQLQQVVVQVANHLEQNDYKFKEALVKAANLECVPSSN